MGSIRVHHTDMYVCMYDMQTFQSGEGSRQQSRDQRDRSRLKTAGGSEQGCRPEPCARAVDARWRADLGLGGRVPSALPTAACCHRPPALILGLGGYLALHVPAGVLLRGGSSWRGWLGFLAVVGRTSAQLSPAVGGHRRRRAFGGRRPPCSLSASVNAPARPGPPHQPLDCPVARP